MVIFFKLHIVFIILCFFMKFLLSIWIYLSGFGMISYVFIQGYLMPTSTIFIVMLIEHISFGIIARCLSGRLWMLLCCHSSKYTSQLLMDCCSGMPITHLDLSSLDGAIFYFIVLIDVVIWLRMFPQWILRCRSLLVPFISVGCVETDIIFSIIYYSLANLHILVCFSSYLSF